MTYHVLLAEDNPDHALITTEAIESVHGGHVVVDHVWGGDEALEYLADASRPLPGLVLMDIKMPGGDGFEALAEIKAHETLRVIPVVMLTSSDDDRDIAHSYSLGSNSYVTKPVGADQLYDRLAQIPSYWFGVNTPPEVDDR